MKRIKLSEEDVKAFRSAAAGIWSEVGDDVAAAQHMGERCNSADHMPYSQIICIVSDRFCQSYDFGFGRTTKMPKAQYERIREYVIYTSDRTVGKLLKGAL